MLFLGWPHWLSPHPQAASGLMKGGGEGEEARRMGLEL